MDIRSENTNFKPRYVKVLFFAKARELAGVNHSEIVVTGTLTYRQLTDKIINQFGLETIRDSIILALNEEWLDRQSSFIEFTDKDEIAVIPPLSGGT